MADRDGRFRMTLLPGSHTVAVRHDASARGSVIAQDGRPVIIRLVVVNL